MRTVKVAPTDFAAFIETTQVAEAPVQAPLQPVKVEPTAGAAVSVTLVPLATVTWHVPPQSMPAGLVTEPVPVPVVATVS